MMRSKLLTQIRGGVQQTPIYAINADGEGGLAAGLKSGHAATDICAVLTCAIPLRKAASGSRSQNFNEHKPGKRLLKLCSYISRHFKAGFLFADLRLCPSFSLHHFLPETIAVYSAPIRQSHMRAGLFHAVYTTYPNSNPAATLIRL